MSWQLGSFAVLAAALAAGFAWYERTRPDARIVALVGTLAAFAALGRIAFAALPNVKPTTDIVLISGYALGGAPGFVVGAVTGLTSNFFFGQGPWTTWQMAAWAATGAFGAGLAIITRRRIGRWPLALVCGVVGFLYAAIQDFGDWVTFSDHSAAQLGVYIGRGIGFDLIHAGGCLVFALALGPALMRSVRRFAQRLQIRWHPDGRLAGPAVMIGLSLVLAGALTAPPSARASATPAAYLLSAQRPDGGFGAGPGAPSSSLYAGWAALGLAAAGKNPADVRRRGASLLDYIRAGAGALSDPGSLERTILVARAAGVSARSFAGHNLVSALEHQIRPDGSVSQQVNLTSFAVLALRAAGIGPAPRTLSWLARQQNHDGGFSFETAGGDSDVDDTGAALEALGRGGRAAGRAVAYLRRQQDRDGGFPSQPGGESNAQSTAWAVQGLLAAGVDPASLHRGGAPSPLQVLQTLIAADGHVRYARSSDQTPVWVTAQALMALDGKPLPLQPVARPAVDARAPRPGGAASSARVRSSRTRPPVRSAVKRPVAAGSRRASHPTHQRSAAGQGAPRALSVYAMGAGLLAALAFAPVGVG
jgi:energy-coupling factor transport system substrate-specific component